jgi:hypothetical protein
VFILSFNAKVEDFHCVVNNLGPGNYDLWGCLSAFEKKIEEFFRESRVG